MATYIYLLLPILIVACEHISNSNFKKQNAWGIGNNIGLVLLGILVVFLYNSAELAPKFSEYLERGSRSAARGLIFWSLGFVLVIFPHVVKNRVRKGQLLEKGEFRKTGWYTALGYLILVFITSLAINFELGH